MSRKRTNRKPLRGIHPFDLIAATQPIRASEVTRIMVKIHDAFADMRAGTATQDQADRIAVVVNVGMVRSEQIGNGQAGVELFQAAQKAMEECFHIHQRHGKWGFTGRGLETMREAIELYAEILAASSALQMARAQNEVMRRIKAGECYCPEALSVETKESA